MTVRSLRSLLLAATLAAAATLVACSAQAEPAAPGAAAAPQEPPVPLLWKVSDEDNSLYLLGAFHLLLPGDYPLSPDVDLAFVDAEKLLFELSPEELASPQLGLQMARAALRTDGTTLDQQLGPELAARLARWTSEEAELLASAGLSPDRLQRFEPWYVGMLITLLRMNSLGFDGEIGLDAHLGGYARAAGKPTAGLETAREQIAFLDGMDPGEQVELLARALDEARDGEAEFLRLHAAWRAGDVDALMAESVDELKRDFPELYRAINVERNDRWVPALEARLREDGSDDTLVVVGAMHLLGEDGVVEKLRARGYTVERICSACAAP